jgi:hypothetical protein
VFLNAPFSCQVAWIKKLADELAQNRVSQVVMVYNVHGLGMIIDRCPQLVRGSILLPYRRPAFFDPATGKTVGTPFSTLVLYYGSRQLAFARVFGGKGIILRSVTTPAVFMENGEWTQHNRKENPTAEQSA